MNISEEERERRMVFAREKAAQAWCTPTNENKVMDTELAEAFAEIIMPIMYAPHLGCATTREILDELTARSDLDYKTVADESVFVGDRAEQLSEENLAGDFPRGSFADPVDRINARL